MAANATSHKSEYGVPPSYTLTESVTSCSGFACTGTLTYCDPGCSGGPFVLPRVFGGGEGPPQQSCNASIDASNPAWSRSAGMPPQSDGKCPTGRYTQADDQKVMDRIRDFGGLTQIVARDLVPDILAKGKPIEATGPRELSGPGSAPKPGPGTTTTTTAPDGSTTTTTTPPGTNNYTYNGPKITYITTTTTTNNGGDTTTTTGDPQPDPCDANPDRVGCVKLGDPGDGKPVWAVKDIPFEVEDLGLGGSCPVPFTFSLRGWTLAMDWQPACDVAPFIRAGVLLLAGIGCILLITRETA